jgi:hypothetical protein
MIPLPNPSEAVYAAAQPYNGKALGERSVSSQGKAASWMRPVSHWCPNPMGQSAAIPPLQCPLPVPLALR